MKRHTLRLPSVTKKLLPNSGSPRVTQTVITMHQPTPSGGRERGVKCEGGPNYLVRVRGCYFNSPLKSLPKVTFRFSSTPLVHLWWITWQREGVSPKLFPRTTLRTD